MLILLPLLAPEAHACTCRFTKHVVPSRNSRPLSRNLRPTLATQGGIDQVQLVDEGGAEVPVERVVEPYPDGKLVQVRPLLPLPPGRYLLSHVDEDGDRLLAGRFDVVDVLDTTPAPPVTSVRTRLVRGNRSCDDWGWYLRVRAAIPSEEDVLVFVYDGDRLDQVVSASGTAMFALGLHTPCGPSRVSLRGTDVRLVVRDAAGNESLPFRFTARAWLWGVE